MFQKRCDVIMKMNKKQKNIATILVCLVILGAIYAVDNGYVGNNYYKRILNLGAIYAIVSCSMNLVNGFTGLFSLGQAGFMAIGAYTVAIFTVPVEVREAIFYVTPMNDFLIGIQLPFFGALILGGLLAALLAISIGLPVLRLRSDYLAIATLGVSEIIRIVFNNITSITNGPLGINRIPNISTMWLPFGVAFVSIGIMWLLINSSYGRAFKAIREDEIAAEAMGINLTFHKTLVFAVSAFFAAVGGGLYASLLASVAPSNFYFTLTYTFLLIIVLGGMGSLSGTVISSFLVVIAMEYLRIFDSAPAFGLDLPIFRAGLSMVIFSLALVLIVLFWRKGIMGDQELTWDFVCDKITSIKNKFSKKSKTSEQNEGGAL